MSDDKEAAFFKSSAITEREKKLLDPNSTKHLHLVVIEDPYAKPIEKMFFTSVVDKSNFGLDIKGYEVSKKEIGQIKTWTEALKYAESSNTEMVSLFIPWHRVIKVQNLSYRPK